MNVRQQLYKKYRLEGYSGYAAARKAGYSHSHAKNVRTRVEKEGTFQEILEIAGITDQKLSEVAYEGLMAVGSDGKPDFQIRHKYYETICKLTGKLGVTNIKIDKSKKVTNVQHNTYNVNAVDLEERKKQFDKSRFNERAV